MINKKLIKERIEEALEEIIYWHGDMLTMEERNHPRGSGWARVYDGLKEALKSLRGEDNEN